MARLPRYFVPDQPQHVIQRGNNREPIFAADADYRFYLECPREAARKWELAIHAYVLMTNHVHVLATPSTEMSLPKTLQSVGRRYVQYFNHYYGRTGTLWEGRYRATIIDSERYLMTCSRYIELNPVRAGMVRRPGAYTWSSYRCNALGRRDALLREHPAYRRLGATPAARQQAYRALFGIGIATAELASIRDATNKGWALGNDRFRERIESLTQRRAMPRPRGRRAEADQLEHVAAVDCANNGRER